MKAVILARVSTKRQEDEGLSLEKIQLPQLRNYALEKGFEIDREFVFQETASDKTRRQFNEMLDYVKDSQTVRKTKKEENIKAIIGFRVDRLTRNFRDAVEMDILRKAFDIELHFVSDRLVLKKDDYGTKILEWDMKVFLAKQHINRGQEDAYNIIQNKLESGQVFSRHPFAYKAVRNSEGRPELILDPYNAQIVKRIFDWYTTDVYSMLSIVHKLKEEYNLKMDRSQVARILNTKFYAGIMKYKGKEYPHVYETIIAPETFNLSQNIMKGRKPLGAKKKLYGKHGIYRGLLTCAECGCSYTPSFRRKKYVNGKFGEFTNYYCTNAKRVHAKVPPGLSEKELTRQFAEVFKKLQMPKERLNWLVNSLEESHKGLQDHTQGELDKSNEMIKKYQTMIENAYADKCAGLITQEHYDKVYSEWREKQTEWKRRLDTVLTNDDQFYFNATNILKVASQSHEIFLSLGLDQKRELIKMTLQDLTIKDGKLRYKWKKPFDMIYKSVNSPKWWGLQDTFAHLREVVANCQPLMENFIHYSNYIEKV